VYCGGEVLIVIDISMLVEDMLIFMDAELEGVAIVIFIMLVVVEVWVPEYEVCTAGSLPTDDIVRSGMVLIVGMVLLISAIGIDDVAAGATEDTPAAPQRVLANA
jgi:protein-S-isoprenylcysteine O-methyltransferase Ste14